MSIIVTPEPGEATGEVAETYAEDIADMGYVPSHTRVMATNPEAYRAWENLIGSIARPMDKRRYELITLAAAGALRSKACRLAHGKKSLQYISEDELVRVARDYHDAGLSAAEVADDGVRREAQHRLGRDDGCRQHDPARARLH